MVDETPGRITVGKMGNINFAKLFLGRIMKIFRPDVCKTRVFFTYVFLINLRF